MQLFEEFFDDIEIDDLIDDNNGLEVNQEDYDYDKVFGVCFDKDIQHNKFAAFLDNCTYVVNYKIEQKNKVYYQIHLNGHLTLSEAQKLFKQNLTLFNDESKVEYNNKSFISFITNSYSSSDMKFFKSRLDGNTLDLSGLVLNPPGKIFSVAQISRTIKYIDLRGTDTSKLKYLSFQGLSSLEEIYGIEDIDTSNIIITKDMFQFCMSLKSLDLNKWDMSNVKNMSDMFSECISLENIQISDWDVNSVKNMSKMFNSCRRLQKLDINDWDMKNVEDISGMFSGCTKLSKLNIDRWDVSNIKDMSYLFFKSNISNFNLNDWNVSEVKDISNMFSGCSKLKNLDLGNWKTPNLNNVYGMFSLCSLLSYVDLSNFNLSQIEEDGFYDMFYDCKNLKKIKCKAIKHSNDDQKRFMHLNRKTQIIE